MQLMQCILEFGILAELFIIMLTRCDLAADLREERRY